ncbi:MAG: dienelactone hydrolase family protein [Geminicoccaceae bacterium]
MHEREVEIETADGTMPVFITHPEEDGQHPTVIFFMDALGIREELRDMARRIGTVGYYVMLANLFYRDGGPSFDSALLLTKGPDPEMMRLNMALTHAKVLADTEAMLRLAEDDPAARDPVGAIGYCMGGRHAYAAAGSFPERVAAMASLHGGFQVTNRPDSAHRLTPHIKARCYFGFADGDPLSPPEHQRIIADACRKHSVTARLETYTRAEHGFTFPTRYCYHKPSAERAWERVFSLFRQELG